MKTPDLYDTLGVPRDAKPRDIKAAYRKRAAAAHPDKGGNDEDLQAINAMEAALAKVEKQLGRYRLVQDPATLQPIEGENFIESRLLAVKADITIGVEGLRRDLSTCSEALVCCTRYQQAPLTKEERQFIMTDYWAQFSGNPLYSTES